MNKLKKMILMLCLVLPGALCYAHGVARMESQKDNDITLEVLEKSLHGSSDKSGYIAPSINGRVLTVTFNDNLGRVSVEVATIAGDPVQCLSVLTPNGLQFYIPFEGDYIVTFTLSNGDEYYSEFTVTD